MRAAIIRQFQHLVRGESGASIVELAAIIPVLALILLGAADFARVYFTDLAAANASRAGAEYGVAYDGIVNPSQVVDSMIYGTNREAGKDSLGMVITAGRFCSCPDGTVPDCVSGSCGAYGTPRVFDSVAVKKIVKFSLHIPGMPDSAIVLRKTILRGN